MKFKKELLLNKGLPWAAVERKPIRHNRWSVTFQIVFEHEGKHYLTTYNTAATESQTEEPWEYEREVECIPVQQVERFIKVWEPISEQ